MAELASLVGRFPRHELAIHRLYAHNSEFKAICTDHEEAVAALRHWERTCGASDPRVLEYRQLVRELELEIAAIIDGGTG
jgi:hypothetical protein